MATIVTRAGKGSALTHAEVDANFTNLNTNKAEVSGTLTAGYLAKCNGTNVVLISAVYQDANGRIGIGTASPGAELEVADTAGDNDVRINLRANGSTISQVGASSTITFIDSQGTRPFIVYTNGTERLRVDGTNGTLTSQPTYDNTAATGSNVVVSSVGEIRRLSSSIKYKTDVESLDPALVTNAIDGLRPVWYRAKSIEGDNKPEWSQFGLIAEEVHLVEPRLVNYRTAEAVTDEYGNRTTVELAEPEPEGVDYARLSVLLLAEVKELRARVAALEGIRAANPET